MCTESHAMSEPVSSSVEPSLENINTDNENDMTLNMLLDLLIDVPQEARTRFVKCLKSRKRPVFESHRAFARYHEESPPRFKAFMKSCVTWTGCELTPRQKKKIYVYCTKIKTAKPVGKSKKTKRTTIDKDAQTDDVDGIALPFDGNAMACNNVHTSTSDEEESRRGSDEDEEDEGDE
jgi:hypothetical protein